MLTSTSVTEGVASVLKALKNSDIDGARRKVEELLRETRTERERGCILAAAGIATAMSKGKDGAVYSWDSEKLLKAAKRISSSQMSDEFDRGYAETLVSYAALTAARQ